MAPSTTAAWKGDFLDINREAPVPQTKTTDDRWPGFWREPANQHLKAMGTSRNFQVYEQTYRRRTELRA